MSNCCVPKLDTLILKSIFSHFGEVYRLSYEPFCMDLTNILAHNDGFSLFAALRVNPNDLEAMIQTLKTKQVASLANQLPH